MPKYNISSKKHFEVLNIVGNLEDRVPKILIFGSYENERSINNTRLELGSFYGDNIIGERGIWSAVACSSGYNDGSNKFQNYGAIIKTLPIERGIEFYMKDQVRTHGPYYLCNSLISDLVLAITPWDMARKMLHRLALKRTSYFLGRGQRSVNVGGDCDKGAHYYHERILDIKRVRDLISGREYEEWGTLHDAIHEEGHK